MRLTQGLQQSALHNPTRTATVFENRHRSYAEVIDRVARLAAGLTAMGAKTGDRIARMQSAAGLPATCSGVLGLVASFFFGLHALYYQNELNKIWAHLGGAAEGTVVTLPSRPSAGPEGTTRNAA